MSGVSDPNRKKFPDAIWTGIGNSERQSLIIIHYLLVSEAKRALQLFATSKLGQPHWFVRDPGQPRRWLAAREPILKSAWCSSGRFQEDQPGS